MLIYRCDSPTEELAATDRVTYRITPALPERGNENPSPHSFGYGMPSVEGDLLARQVSRAREEGYDIQVITEPLILAKETLQPAHEETRARVIERFDL